MISPLKLRANRKNAAKSTGPRTCAGKARASRNALRHGFESVSFKVETLNAVVQMANKLCENDPFPYRYEAALAIAESQFLIGRIRFYRSARLAGAKLSKVKDMSTSRSATRKSQRQLGDAGCTLSELLCLERYEHRALSRRNRAIRRFDALSD